MTHDYGEKMFEGLKASRNLLKNAAQYVLLQDRHMFHRKFLESDFVCLKVLFYKLFIEKLTGNHFRI